jgi:hypothetical protein
VADVALGGGFVKAVAGRFGLVPEQLGQGVGTPGGNESGRASQLVMRRGPSGASGIRSECDSLNGYLLGPRHPHRNVYRCKRALWPSLRASVPLEAGSVREMLLRGFS